MAMPAGETPAAVNTMIMPAMVIIMLPLTPKQSRATLFAA
jgi:hypothetical protein